LACATVLHEGTENSYALAIETARFGVVVRILAYYARGCGFDSHTVQTFVCMNMSVLGLGVSMYNMYVLTKKKYVSIYKYKSVI
jgi:hypothetical protein